jgi:hypothetical protein
MEFLSAKKTAVFVDSLLSGGVWLSSSGRKQNGAEILHTYIHMKPKIAY